MHESTEVRLARIEERQIHISDLIERHIKTQQEANEQFWDVRSKVFDIEARANGAWWILVQMGSITVAVAGLVAWVVARWKSGA